MNTSSWHFQTWTEYDRHSQLCELLFESKMSFNAPSVIHNEEDLNNRFKEAAKKHKQQKRKEYLHGAQFDCEKWSAELEQAGLSFKTRFLPLSIEEAKAIVSYYRQHSLKWKNACTLQYVQLLKDVEQRIQETIEKEFSSSQHVFVRLSSRSPKDAPLFEGMNTLCHDRLTTLYVQKLKHAYKLAPEKLPSLESCTLSPTWFNREYTTLWEALKESLKVQNAKEAMDLILNSERVFLDLLAALEFPEDEHGNEAFSIKVIIREWNEGLRYSHEFRGFVYKNKLTCISQYDPHCYFEELAGKEAQLAKSMQDYFESQVKSKIVELLVKQDSSLKDNDSQIQYILDFGVLDDNQVKVIELNATQNYEQDIACAGSGCFSWQQDKEIIIGDKPFELRIHSKPPLEDPKTQVCFDWFNIVEKYRKIALAQVLEETSWCIVQ